MNLGGWLFALQFLDGLMQDLDTALRASENGNSFGEQVEEDYAPYPWVDTPFGIQDNPFYWDGDATDT